MLVNDLNLVIEIVKKKGHNLSKVFFKSAMNLAKKENSAELAYELAVFVDNGNNKNVEKIRQELCEVVVKSKSAKYAYLYARDIPGAYIDSLQKVVEQSNSLEFATEFAADIYGIDITNLQKIVIDAKNPDYAFKFAKFVKDADIKSLENIVAKSKNIKLIERFINEIDGANIKRLNSIKTNLLKAKSEREL